MKLLLIDGSNLIFRAYYATEKQNITAPNGVDVNAIHTLIPMITKMIKQHEPTHIFIALDLGSGTFRHDAYADYKGKRNETPDRLKEQFAIAKELYDAMGIIHYATEKYEADDLIATLARRAEQDGMKVQIVSGDKDLLQLVNENINVLTPAMGFAKEVDYTPEVFTEKFGFTPDRFIEYKALIGDKSDNIIGIDKLGDKTAKKFIDAYDNIDEIIDAANSGEIKNKVGENIKNNNEQIKENLFLVKLIDDITPEEFDYELSDFVHDSYDEVNFIPFLKKYGFNRFIKQFGNTENTTLAQSNYVKLETFDLNLTTETVYIYPQTLESNYFIGQNIGLGICVNKRAYYLDMANIDTNFIDFLNSDVKKVIYNVKQLMGMLKVRRINNVAMDIYLAAELLTNHHSQIDLLASTYSDFTVSTFEQIYKAKSNPVLPEKEVYENDIAAKAVALEKLYLPLLFEIENQKVNNVYFDIELPLTQVLSRMEQNGILIDEAKVEHFIKHFQDKLIEVNEKVKQITDININSPMQLSKYLENYISEGEIKELKLKKTKTGISTDIDNLTKICEDVFIADELKEFLTLVLENRDINKLLNTYLLNLKNFADNNNYIHPIYNQLLTETGRISATDPNIQNMPIRREEGRFIRELFIAPNDKKLVAIDYSQVELRVIAKMANETTMLSDFEHGLDIHTETAKKIFGNGDKESRSRSKAINFGIIYGMSEYGLAKQLGITPFEAKKFIEAYFNTYPNIKTYMETTIDGAMEKGYVETHFKRPRYIKELSSSKHMERESGKRMAINSPIQGTAADIIKIAMLKIDEFIEGNDDIKMAMQIHDELVFYVKDESVAAKLKEIMEDIENNYFNLVADIEVGDNWLFS